jgi:hypothetical protein
LDDKIARHVEQAINTSVNPIMVLLQELVTTSQSTQKTVAGIQGILATQNMQHLTLKPAPLAHAPVTPYDSSFSLVTLKPSATRRTATPSTPPPAHKTNKNAPSDSNYYSPLSPDRPSHAPSSDSEDTDAAMDSLYASNIMPMTSRTEKKRVAQSPPSTSADTSFDEVMSDAGPKS